MTHNSRDNSNRARANTGFSGGKSERSFKRDHAHFSAVPIVHEIPDPRKGDRVCKGDGQLRLAKRDSAQVPNLFFKPAPPENQNSSTLFKMTRISSRWIQDRNHCPARTNHRRVVVKGRTLRQSPKENQIDGLFSHGKKNVQIMFTFGSCLTSSQNKQISVYTEQVRVCT